MLLLESQLSCIVEYLTRKNIDLLNIYFCPWLTIYYPEVVTQLTSKLDGF